MNNKTSYNQQFVQELNRLKREFPKLIEIEGLSDDHFDISKFTETFYTSNNNANATIDDNANLGQFKTVHSFASSAFKPHTKLNSYYLMWNKLMKNYSLSEANEILRSIISGDIYVHDATNMTIPYCFNYTCYDVVTQGLPEWTGIADISAPTTLNSYTNQIKNFLVSAASQQMGATGIADKGIFDAWYVQKNLLGYGKGNMVEELYKDRATFEKAVWDELRRVTESFIYDLNFKYKGDQSLFTNISLYDDYFLDTMLADIEMPGPVKKIDKDIVKKCQEIYCEVYSEILEKTLITYPVTTACFSIYDEAEYTINGVKAETDSVFSKITGGVFKKIVAVTPNELKIGDVINDARFGEGDTVIESIDKKVIKQNVLRDDNFKHMIAKYNIDKQWCNIYNGETSVLSSCCRLRSNVDEFENFNSVTGSGSAKIGSLGVATINMPRIAYKYALNEIDDVFAELAKLTEMTMKINYVKRLMIQESIDQGVLPIYTDGFMVIDRQFLTTGIIGVYELAEALGWELSDIDGEGINNLIKLLDTVTDTHSRLRQEDDRYTNIRFNMEQVPGESASVKLCQKDMASGYDVTATIYSNQFIPLKSDVSMLTRIAISGKLDSKMSGGSTLHICVDNPFETIDQLIEFMELLAEAGVKTWAVNHTLGKCKDCNSVAVYAKGNYFCKHCGSPNVDLYERIVGYLVAVEAFSKHKKLEDFDKRYYYGGDQCSNVKERAKVLTETIEAVKSVVK